MPKVAHDGEAPHALLVAAPSGGKRAVLLGRVPSVTTGATLRAAAAALLDGSIGGTGATAGAAADAAAGAPAGVDPEAAAGAAAFAAAFAAACAAAGATDGAAAGASAAAVAADGTADAVGPRRCESALALPNFNFPWIFQIPSRYSIGVGTMEATSLVVQKSHLHHSVRNGDHSKPYSLRGCVDQSSTGLRTVM